jgi:leucyl aminopeptidase
LRIAGLRLRLKERDKVQRDKGQTKFSSIDRVDFFIDGNLIETDPSSPYSSIWDTSYYLDGIHIIEVIVIDNMGQTANDQITVSVSNY